MFTSFKRIRASKSLSSLSLPQSHILEPISDEAVVGIPQSLLHLTLAGIAVEQEVEAEGLVVMIPSQLGAGPRESETHFSLSCVAGCPPWRHPIYPNDGGVGGVTRES